MDGLQLGLNALAEKFQLKQNQPRTACHQLQLEQRCGVTASLVHPSLEKVPELWKCQVFDFDLRQRVT